MMVQSFRILKAAKNPERYQPTGRFHGRRQPMTEDPRSSQLCVSRAARRAGAAPPSHEDDLARRARADHPPAGARARDQERVVIAERKMERIIYRHIPTLAERVLWKSGQAVQSRFSSDEFPSLALMKTEKS